MKNFRPQKTFAFDEFKKLSRLDRLSRLNEPDSEKTPGDNNNESNER